MENAVNFRQKINDGGCCLGSGVTFFDSTVAELLSQAGMDFVWIDMEHNALTVEAVQNHIIATRASDAAAIVRVGAGDPTQIKVVLDSGADGVVVPMVRTAEEVRRVVADCRYPPEGRRGFGPRRPSRYGRLGGPEFCRLANESVLVIIQIELIDAVDNLDAILKTPGLDSVVVGPNDLAGSMGFVGQPDHPEVVKVVESIIQKSRAANVMAGLAATVSDPQRWAALGVQWFILGTDWIFLVQAVDQALNDTQTSLH